MPWRYRHLLNRLNEESAFLGTAPAVCCPALPGPAPGVPSSQGTQARLQPPWKCVKAVVDTWEQITLHKNAVASLHFCPCNIFFPWNNGAIYTTEVMWSEQTKFTTLTDACKNDRHVLFLHFGPLPQISPHVMAGRLCSVLESKGHPM